jgi:hypothetical protein
MIHFLAPPAFAVRPTMHIPNPTNPQIKNNQKKERREKRKREKGEYSRMRENRENRENWKRKFEYNALTVYNTALRR